MSADIDRMLLALQARIDAELNRIHDEALRRLDWLARSTGQRTRRRLPGKPS